MDLNKRIVNYWNKTPCNIKHGASKFGTTEYFHEVTERRYTVEPHIKKFAGFHLWAGKRVLEIGCGIGTDAEQFVRAGAEYIGIDLSEKSIEICQRRFDVQGLDGKFYVANAVESLTKLLGNEPFDLVYSFGVLHHYPDINIILDNIMQVMSAKSELRFMVYAKSSWKYAMIQAGLAQFEAQAGCPYAKAYTIDDVYNLVQDKFKIERIRQDHCFMYNVDEYNNKNYVLEPWFAAMSDEVKDAVKEYLGWHLLVKAKLL